MSRKNLKVILLFAVSLVLCIGSFCTDKSTQPVKTGKGTAVVKIHVADGSTYKKLAHSAIISLFALDMAPIIQSLSTTDTGAEIRIVGIAPGKARLFTIEVADSVDTLQYTGQASSDIVADSVVHITISLLWVSVPADGLVAYYPFKGDATDESGNGNDGSVNGALPINDRFDEPENAFSFNGLSDYILCKSYWFTTTPSQFTISLWFQLASPVAVGAQLAVFHGAPAEFNFGIITDSVAAGIHTSRTPDQWKGLYYPLKSTVGWHHAVMVYKVGVDFSLYIDTVRVAKLNAPSGIITAPANCKCGFGRYLCGDSNIQNYKGDLDDVRIYNRVLTDSDIQRLYHEGSWTGN